MRAAIEKNRFLFHWKHIDDPKSLQEHLAFLYRFAIDAWLGDRRNELQWLALALEETERVLAARNVGDDAHGFREILRTLRAGSIGS